MRQFTRNSAFDLREFLNYSIWKDFCLLIMLLKKIYYFSSPSNMVCDWGAEKGGVCVGLIVLLILFCRGSNSCKEFGWPMVRW